MSYFTRGTVVRDLEAQNKYDAIEEILDKARVFSRLENKRILLKDIFLREYRQNTGFGHGVAVAHGISEVPEVIIALGVSKRGINYGSPDGKPVHLLFVIASPKYHWDVYLCSLSALVKLLRNEAFRQNVLQAVSEAETEELLYKSLSLQLEME